MIENFIAMHVLIEIDEMVLGMLTHDKLFEICEKPLYGVKANEGNSYHGR